jgi:hypothetical protein
MCASLKRSILFFFFFFLLPTMRLVLAVVAALCLLARANGVAPSIQTVNGTLLFTIPTGSSAQIVYVRAFLSVAHSPD